MSANRNQFERQTPAVGAVSSQPSYMDKIKRLLLKQLRLWWNLSV